MTGKTKRLLITLIAAIFLSGCTAANLHYSQVQTGEIQGRLTVQWVNHDQFHFIPDPLDPFRFIRYDGEEIVPNQIIRTDGGSIPRFFWIFRTYSPWGYAPAYIIHDWLYETNHCPTILGYERYDYREAAWVMSEVVKTLMEDPKFIEEPEFCPDNGRKYELKKNKRILYSLYKAVSSKIAEDLWESGCCDEAP